MKNHVCALLFASGTPMLLGGDEFARTQRGNNNAYCQDNAISWFDWDAAVRRDDLVEFFRKAIAFVRRFPILQRRRFSFDRGLDHKESDTLTWFGPDQAAPRWNDAEARTLCVQLKTLGDAAGLDVRRLFTIMQAGSTIQRVSLPPVDGGGVWRRAIDTSLAAGKDFAATGAEVRLDPPDTYIVNPRSTVVLLA
jgi:glycogen operon protein